MVRLASSVHVTGFGQIVFFVIFFLCSDFQLCCSNLIGFMRIRLWCVLIEKRRREIFAFKIFSRIKNPLILISIRECMHYKN